ncbi:MAG: hypothetical protein AB1921_18250, partial [Thermodesulfobacteriota bacterium]
QVASFLIFLFIINRLAFRPLKEKIGEREGKITTLKTDVADMQSEMTRLSAEMAKQESATRKKATSLINKMKESAQTEAGAALSKSLERVTEMRNQSAARVQLELAEARKSLDAEAKAISMDIMEKVLGRRLQ